MTASRYVPFSELSAELQQQVADLYPPTPTGWDARDYPRFRFGVTKAGRISRSNGDYQLTREEGDRIVAELKEGIAGDARSKNDLQGWTGSPRFHLSRD